MGENRLSNQAKVVAFSSSGDIPEWAYSSTHSLLESLRIVDPMTHAHCLRVGKYSFYLAQAAGLTEYEQKVAEFAGMLHDVGKMGIERAIVHKPGRLTNDEYGRMMSHPVLSAEIIQPLTHHDFFRQVVPAVRAHHERVDGEGYPDKLSDDGIPLLARVILIVDTLDAMGQDRSYRKGLPLDAIYRELQRFAGTQFDKSLVRIFLDSHRFWKNQVHDDETFHKIVSKVA